MDPTNKHDGVPWQALEEGAYHAYREWPVWLVLRERELAQRLEPARGAAGARADDRQRPSTQDIETA